MQHSNTVQKALEVKKLAEEKGIPYAEACRELGLNPKFYSNTKVKMRLGQLKSHPDIYQPQAIDQFCNDKSLDLDNVKHFWYKGKFVNGDSISAFLKHQDENSIREYISTELIETIGNLAPMPLPKLEQKNYKQPIILELNLYDCHFGKRDFLTDEGTKETSQRFKESISKFVEFTLYNYKIQGITIAIGNDLFNVDNVQHTTTRGTPQDQDMPFEKMFVFVQKLVLETLLTLSRIAPLDVVMVRGNHDYSTVFMLGQVLEAYFSNHTDVHIDNGLGRKIRFFGNTAVGFAHGEKDIMKTPSLIYTEFLDSIFKHKERTGIQPKYFEWHCGHWHGLKTTIQENGGIITRFFSSLSVNDRWHYNEGYVGNRISASALIHSLENGVVSTQTIMF